MPDLDTILLIALVGEIFLFGASISKIYQYAEVRRLVPSWWWQRLVSLVAPWDVIKVYIQDTQKETGRIGIWFKLMIGSFLAMIPTSAALVALSATK